MARRSSVPFCEARREIMRQSRAFVQREILPRAAGAHSEVKEIKARHEGQVRRERLRAMARAYLKQLGEAGITGALFPEEYGGNGRGVVAECIINEELGAAGHPGDTIRSVTLTLGTISILRYGTPEQKKRHIPLRLRGDELAPLNGGCHVLMDELDTERVTYCMAALGSARRALEIAAEYSTKRTQLKQPIAMFEGGSLKLAAMCTALKSIQALSIQSAMMTSSSWRWMLTPGWSMGTMKGDMPLCGCAPSSVMAKSVR